MLVSYTASEVAGDDLGWWWWMTLRLVPTRRSDRAAEWKRDARVGHGGRERASAEVRSCCPSSRTTGQMYARTVFLRRMSRTPNSAALRTAAIGRHLMSTSASPSPSQSRVDPPDEAPVLFESNGSIRTYILNRPRKLNALNDEMLNILRPQVEVSFPLLPLEVSCRRTLCQDWAQGKLAKVIVGRGVGRAFCAGGDVESKSASIHTHTGLLTLSRRRDLRKRTGDLATGDRFLPERVSPHSRNLLALTHLSMSGSRWTTFLPLSPNPT